MAKEFEEKVLESLTKMQGDIESLKTLIPEVKTLKGDVRRLEVLHEETDAKIDAVIEGMSPTIEKVVDHELRITRLEAA